MTDYTPEEIERDKRIIAAATLGPWTVQEGYRGGDFIVVDGLDENGEPRCIECPGSGGAMSYSHHVCQMQWAGTPEWNANAAFIAAARTGWPKALEAIEARDKEIERLNIDRRVTAQLCDEGATLIAELRDRATLTRIRDGRQ